MATIPATNSSSNSGSTNSSSAAINQVDTDQFLKLMIAELQNQDPLNPADNSQLLTQISQIRQVASSDKLSTTLDSVLLGQNLTSGTSLIGKKISALSDENAEVSGNVSKVTVAGGVVKIHVKDAKDAEHIVSLKNIKDILPAAVTTS